MPPKKQKSSRDWDWVSHVPDASQITARHRRTAAGLAGQLQCSFPYSSLNTPGPSTLSDSGSDIVITRDTACSAAKCRRNPRCYNHLGIAAVINQSKEAWVDSQLGDPPAMREDSDQPAGLRNLGATCYANAFLQVWYRNIGFRNGVYQAAQTAKADTPIYHLAIVFASLQYSTRAVVDPSPLIDSLGLKKGDQQDAAEFSKLFISLIDDAFARSPDPSVRNTVKDLFQGKIENVNTCMRCKTSSHSQQPLLELDLALTKKSNTVEECLADMHSVERLTGENQYHCSVCDRKQDAERTTFIRQVPPYLNLCLMRFTYEKNRRIKSKATIRYKRELKVGDQSYKLSAVVVHVGTSAHHGHFKCDVWDEESSEWIVCNDEVIEKPDRAKRRKTDPACEDDGYISSNQAYMLVYRLEREEAAMQPPKAIMDKVNEDSAEAQGEIMERKRREEIGGDDWGHLQGAKLDVIRHLPGTDRIVPTAELRTWLAASTVEDLWMPWDFSSIQCIHGGVNPNRGGDCTLISEQAFEKIHIDPSTPFPDIEVCPVCVEAEYEQLKWSGNLAEAVRTFDAMNDEATGDYVLPRDWVQAWRKGEVGVALPTDMPYSIICDHGSRWDNGAKTTLVSGQGIALLRSLLSDFKVVKADEPMCGECAEASAGDRAARDEALSRGRVEWKMWNRQIQPHSPNPPFGVPYVLLPRGWSKAWRATVKEGVDCPVPWNVGVCEHGGLNWDPAIEGPEWADEDAFDAMCERYGRQPKVELAFGPNKLPGKAYNVAHLQPGVCEMCRKQRLSMFETAWIKVKFGRPGDQQVVMDRRSGTKTRGGKAGYQLEVRKDMTVKDIKLNILQAKQLSPIYQLLRYNGTELVDASQTIADLGIVEHEEIWCEVLEDQDDEMLGGRAAEGFGGTALVGNIACPTCTLLNQGSALACDACGTEFAFG